jgi:hypothetical protein
MDSFFVPLFFFSTVETNLAELERKCASSYIPSWRNSLALNKVIKEVIAEGTMMMGTAARELEHTFLCTT